MLSFKYQLLLFLLICAGSRLSAQSHISPAAEAVFQQREDSMKVFAYNVINDSTPEGRFRADSQFIRSLVKALKIPYSFDYPFDSLQTISKLYAPDSSFRIFTWQLVINDEDFTRQHGAIQMRTADGSLKLFPLIDKSEIIKNAADTITDNRSWIGAVY